MSGRVGGVIDCLVSFCCFITNWNNFDRVEMPCIFDFFWTEVLWMTQESLEEGRTNDKKETHWSGVVFIYLRLICKRYGVKLLSGCGFEGWYNVGFGWWLACLTSQQQASVPQGRICSDNFTCCHTEIEVADQTFYLTQSQYIDTGPTSPSADPITPGSWQGSHWSANFLSHWYDSTPKKSRRKCDSNPGPSALEADALPLGQRGGHTMWESGKVYRFVKEKKRKKKGTLRKAS